MCISPSQKTLGRSKTESARSTIKTALWLVAAILGAAAQPLSVLAREQETNTEATDEQALRETDAPGPDSRAHQLPLTLDDLFARAATLTLKRKAMLAAAAEQRAQVTELKAQALPRLTFEASGAYVNTSAAAPQDARVRPGVDKRLDGERYAWALGFNAPVFGFGRLRDVFVLAEKQEEIIHMGSAVAERRYQEELLRTFSNAILALNEASVAQADLRTREKLLDYVRLETQAGSRPRVDLLQAQAAARAAEARLADAEARSRSGSERLAALLDLPSHEPLRLAQDLSAAGSFFDNMNATLGEKLEVRQARIQMELADIEVEYQRSTRWPILSVFGRASNEVNSFLPPTNLGPARGALEQASLADLFEPERFTYTAGLSLNWTIVEGMAIPARAEKAQASLIQARTQALLSEKEQQTERSESAARLVAAKLGLKAASEGREAAVLLAAQAEQDYRSGQISLRALLETQDDLTTAVQNVFVQWSQKLAVAAQFKIAHGIPLDPKSPMGTTEPGSSRPTPNTTQNGSEE